MKKASNHVAYLFAVAALVFLLASCDQASNPSETPAAATPQTPKPLIGVVLPSSFVRWVNDGNALSSAITASNYRCTVLTGDDTSKRDIANIKTLMDAGMKALIIAPVNNDAAFLESLASAKAAGVKIVSFDRLITNSADVDFYASFDNTKVGEIMGQYLVERAGTAKSIPLYLYAGSRTDNNAILFFKGGWNKLQPKIADGTFLIQNSAVAKNVSGTLDLTRDQILSIFDEISITNWDPSIASDLAKGDIAVPDAVKGGVFILAPNDATGRSIYDAFKADAAVTSIVITGQDAEKPSVQRIIDDTQSMTIFKNTRTLSEETARIAIALVEGKSPQVDAQINNGKINVPSRLLTATRVTKLTVKADLIDSGYYKASDFDLTNLPK